MMRMQAALVVLTVLAPARGAGPAPMSLDPALRQRCLAVLRAGLRADEFWPAMHAAEALSQAGLGDEVLPALAGRTPGDDQQRCGLAREAVRAGRRDHLAVLLEVLGKPGSNGHVHAAESLFKVAETGDGVLLRRALADSDDVRLRLMAAAALARGGPPGAADALRQLLRHPQGDVRRIAGWVLGQLGTAAEVPLLRQALGRADEPLGRAFLVHALACLGDAEARRLLGENLASSDPAVRTYAAEFAGIARTLEHRERVIGLLQDPTLDTRIRAAGALLAMARPAPEGEGFSRDVYPAMRETPRYSEGSVAVLRDGSLLYATTEFVGGRADHATARIVARTSADRGRTWGEPRVLQENVGKQNVMSVTLRRLRPGRVDGPLGMFYLVKNGPTDLKVYLRVSTDEARTFGQPVCATPGEGYHVMNNDRVAVLSTGRLLCPVAWTADVARPGSHFVSFCYYSDDGGKTWRKGAGRVDQPRRGAMEPEVLELDRGRLLMIVRTQLGFIATSISKDGGSTWGEPGRLPVKAPEAPATIRRIPATGDLLLVWNDTFDPAAGHGGKRTPLTAAVSSDEGRTWEHVRNLEDSPDRQYTYTSVLFLEGRLLLTYYVQDPRTGWISSRFRSLPVRRLYQGEK